MLDKLVAQLKQSLPEPLRKKMGIEDTNADDEHSEEQNEDSHDTTDNENGDAPPAEDKKKKQISMLIRVVIILGLAYMGVTEFILKEDQNTVPDVPIKRHTRVKPKKEAKGGTPGTDAKVADANAKPADSKPADAAKQEAATVANTTTPATTPAAEVKPAETKPAETQAPIENINIADKKTDETSAPTPKTEEKPIDETPIVKAPAETTPTPQVGEVKTSEALDKNLDSLIDNVDKKEGTSATEAAPKKETSMADKIVADDVYVAPPAYDQLGRGLVYNCKEKYWVCLDKTAYIACNKNMKYNKAHGKAAECAVANVYNSDDDCGVVQKYNVSTNKTPPCSN